MGWCNFIAWKRKYVVIIFLALVSYSNEQFQVPMFPMPPMMMMPANLPPNKKPVTTEPPSGTNNNNNIAFAVPVPMPMPLQIAVPAVQPGFCAARPRPPACPPCPPCLCFPTCTPSFFSYCSPCHQKCRCTEGKQPPVPLPPVPPIPAPGSAFGLPMPMGMPPMSIMVPMPPRSRQNYKHKSDRSDSDCSGSRSSDSSSESRDDSSDDDSSSGCEGGACKRSRNRRKHRKHRKHGKNRKMGKIRRRKRIRFGRRTMGNKDKTISIKPILSFIDDRGDIKLKQALNRDDVRALTRDSFEILQQREKTPDIVQNVRLSTNEDAKKRPHILLVSDYEKLNGKDKSIQTIDSKKREQRLLKQGRKELVFKPPGDKTITNLSVSFQVA